ncbi:MAG: TMEM165/GDT1 family protein [Geodermatophilaceae bacterium]
MSLTWTCLFEGASGHVAACLPSLLSTGVIFVAELGDKSQLTAMTFAARYRARDALIGIIATAVVHLASAGSATSSAAPSLVARAHLDHLHHLHHRGRRAPRVRHLDAARRGAHR